MWTPQQRAAFSRALGAVDKVQPVLDRLAQIAKHSPQVAERVRELQARADYVRAVSETALAAEAQNGK
jgi:hypothetical protein